MKNNFLVRAPFRGSSGYATVNRNIILALHKLGHRVYLEPIIWASDHTELSEEEETRLAVIEKDSYLNIPSYEDMLILNLTIPELYQRKSQGVNIGWYIFEADRVPESWKKHIDKMDAIITPTQFNLQQLRTAGYEKPIFLLKEGVNYRLFNPEIKPLFRKDKFSFLLVAVAQERKRWKEIITGYLEEFSSEKVRLILKLQPTQDATIVNIKRFVELERERTGSKAEIMLSLKTIQGTLAPLYTSSDCYISLAGEGWDCPACEAISCGCSGILLDWGGHTEWFTEEMGWKVKVKDIVPVKNMKNYSGYQDKSLMWALPDVEDYKQKLRYAFEHKTEVYQKGMQSSKFIFDNYRWEHTVKNFCDTFKYRTVSILAKRPPKLSVAMITKNEENFEVDGHNVFKSNLNILSKLADEIVVIDSSDNKETIKIASDFGAKIFSYDECPQNCGMCNIVTKDETCPKIERAEKQCFSKFRKASFSKCTGDFILRLDADEILRESDIPFIRAILNEAYFKFYKVFAFGFPTVNFMGKVPYYKAGWDGVFSWYPDFHIRLYRNIPEMLNWFAPAHEGVNILTENGWVNIINHPQKLLLPEPQIFHYGYLKKTSGARNVRYQKMGARTHNLSMKNHYCVGVCKFEGEIPKLSK